jgi:surface polysaccharide O-acyltransferase-like enzyme
MGATAAPTVSPPAAAAKAAPAGGATRSRLVGGDAVRAAAMVGVIGIHAGFSRLGHVYPTVDTLERVSVPAFVVLTGVLLAYGYSGRPLGIGFVRRRFGRTLLPWLAWVPVYLAFDVVTSQLSSDMPSILNWVALGGGHLWFLLLIPQFYLLFAIWPKRQRYRWAAAAVALLLQTALCVLRLYVALPGWQSTVVLTYAAETFPFWVGYFAVGVAVGGSLVRASRLRLAVNQWRLPLAVASTIAVVASSYELINAHYEGAPYGSFLGGTGSFLNPWLPLVVFSASAWIALVLPPLMQRVRFFGRGVIALSEASLGVYIVHQILLYPFFIFLLPAWTFSPGPVAWIAYVAIIVVTLVSSMIVVRVLSATPLAYTLGTRQRPIRTRDAMQLRRTAA